LAAQSHYAYPVIDLAPDKVDLLVRRRSRGVFESKGHQLGGEPKSVAC
jgi:hypothetical protein